MIAKSWRYHNPVEITFGAGKLSCLPSIVGNRNAVVISDPYFAKIGGRDDLRKLLGSSLVATFDGVKPNPTFSSSKRAFQKIKQFKYDIIIALGGGSTIDTAKAVTAIGASGDADWIEDYLKRGAPFPQPFNPKPIIAIPTTAGTGSEVTMWATIWDMDEKKKYSISHTSLYPQKAILDPELTLSLPEEETIYSGLDALSHAMEAIWNKNHNPVSDIFALKAISLVHDYLPELRKDLTNLDLRTHLLRASLFAGLAFSNTKTALAHSISYPLTAYFGLPHGLACALPLPHLLRFNGEKAPERISIMAKALGSDISVESMASEVAQLFKSMGLSLQLADYGIDKNKAGLIVSSAITPGRADNNIVEFDKKDLVEIISNLF
jgi:phosphonate metabolism-associated iron-containing alcohol dehydrogenase